ncbi:uncharacterized protein LOC118411233 isoform X3 [Branchiostoma floridae]|uniref:Uncharacterized protein LOC118411233 isoform X3 n=1 Tax=Branchiostoma floridae TaxID=7739 RepID=A0A9J7KRN6_BRAFL|nr:uncharacterized protein LOC118411233 isoform X3 [Branchiostoma floridae]
MLLHSSTCDLSGRMPRRKKLTKLNAWKAKQETKKPADEQKLEVTVQEPTDDPEVQQIKKIVLMTHCRREAELGPRQTECGRSRQT